MGIRADVGERRRDLLRQTIDELLVIPIGREAIYLRWAELYSHARAHGLPIQNDHNDVWIAATAHASPAFVSFPPTERRFCRFAAHRGWM
jgi:predicted nucleic acid-binding protein